MSSLPAPSLATASLFNQTAVLTHDLGYVWGAAQDLDEPRNGGVVAGAIGAAGTDFWFHGTSSAVRRDDTLSVTEGGAQVYDGGANVHLVRTNLGWTKIALRRCHF